MDPCLKTIVFLLLAIVNLGDSQSDKCMTENVRLVINQIEDMDNMIQDRVRANGQSGIVRVRRRHAGTNNFNIESHSGRSALSMHDHADYQETVGMGEVEAVLNGYMFKTRHNDYSMVMPSKSSKELHAYDPIPSPEVPPDVLAKGTVEEQVAEMREWFKAFVNQNTSVRDYRPFFKATLCYLEGAWFKSGPGQAITESFKSTRHALDADSWRSLREKVYFNVYSGAKSRLENLAVLPTSIMGMFNATFPQLAQWNYRILCHPLKDDLPLSYMHPIEDLSIRFSRDGKQSFDRHISTTRSGRFGLNSKKSPKRGGQYQFGLLDELMEQVPGLDNYLGDIKSSSNDPEKVMNQGGNGLKNQAKYHRVFQLSGTDASGLNLVHRSYNDDYFFGAQTTQDKVVGRDYTPSCRLAKPIKSDCPPIKHQKWSWAIPLEIVYRTPLQAWNPYKIPTAATKSERTKDNRNGDCTKSKAYKGAHPLQGFYRTPLSFFVNANDTKGAADTTRSKVCVLDNNDVVREVKASGHYIFLPKIAGINGRIRIRYPIFPVHGEGSPAWKELNALRALVMDASLNHLKHVSSKSSDAVTLEMQPSRNPNVSLHTHTIQIGAYDFDLLKSNQQIAVSSSREMGHSHQLEIIRRVDKGVVKYWYKLCDNKNECWDKHATTIYQQGLDESSHLTTAVMLLQMLPSDGDKVPMHIHTFPISGKQMAQLKENKTISVVTSTDESHSHYLDIYRRTWKGNEYFKYNLCDLMTKCSDGHKYNLYGAKGNDSTVMTLEMLVSNSDKVPKHKHTFEISAYQLKMLKAGVWMPVTTSTNEGHLHYLQIQRWEDNNGNERFKYRLCDNKETCPDGHRVYIFRKKSNATTALTLEMQVSDGANGVPRHQHTVELNDFELTLLNGSQQIPVTTSKDEGHFHYLEIRGWLQNGQQRFQVYLCDSNKKCSDGHGSYLFRKRLNEPTTLTLLVTLSDGTNNIPKHQHSVELCDFQIALLDVKQQIPVTTSKDDGHLHYLEIRRITTGIDRFKYFKCESSTTCSDGHGVYLFRKKAKEPTVFTLQMTLSDGKNSIPKHQHTVELCDFQLTMLKAKIQIPVTTSSDEGHLHYLFLSRWLTNGQERFRYYKCDSEDKCSDGHALYLYRKRINEPIVLTVEMLLSNGANNVPLHKHTVELSDFQLTLMKAGKQKIPVTTSKDAGHFHFLELGRSVYRGKEYYKYKLCDNLGKCSDGHGTNLYRKKGNDPTVLTLEMLFSHNTAVTLHNHTVEIDDYQLQLLKSLFQIPVTTSTNEGHFHHLEIIRRVSRNAERFSYKLCDTKTKCVDEHSKFMYRKQGNEPAVITLEMSSSTDSKIPVHTHTIPINSYQLTLLKGLQQIPVFTSKEENHVHYLEIYRRVLKDKSVRYWYKICDYKASCSDGHKTNIIKV